jgi:hypothetical protein
MAIGWMTTASHIYLVEGRSSLVKCFDEVVATSVHATTNDLGEKTAVTSRAERSIERAKSPYRSR